MKHSSCPRRRARLVRRRPLRPWRPNPLTPEERARAQWIASQPCCACGRKPCGEGHHAGRRGIGQKAPEDTRIPLCRKCHDAWHDHNGWCKDWDQLERRDWSTCQILRWQLAWANERDFQHISCLGVPW